jgi:uncharacterized membrane protein
MERTSNRTLWIGLGVLALLVLVALPMWGGGMMMGRGVAGPFFRPFFGMGAPWLFGVWGIGLLIRLAFWAGIIFLVVHLFRRSRFAGPDRYDEVPSGHELSSEEILRRRYATGEITREQYEEMRKVLQPTS